MTVTMVGVDPGGRYTGIVTRSGDGVSACCVMTRTTGDDLPDKEYIDEVLREIASQLEQADCLAVEGLVVPHGRRPDGESTIMTVAGIMGTAMIFGAVVARWPHVIVVSPGANGALPEFAYPERIRKRTRLGGPSTHARSAYDVAKSAAVVYRAAQQNPGGSR
jgi:hypothetical protein